MKSTSFLIACLLLVLTAACGHSVETAAPEPVEPVQNQAAVTIVTDPVAANQKKVTEEGVAFIARVNGQTDIFFLSLDGSTLENLTNDNLREDYFEWTPNGAQITYRVALTDDQPFGAPFQNWIMNADGSGKRLLRDCPIGCSPIFWTPDGQKMAIIVTESLTPPHVAVALGDQDGNVKTIVSIYGSVIEQFWWSPNSTKLAYTVINEDRSETLIVLNTTGMYTNYSASSSGRILPIGWSYDSNRLLYIDLSTTPEIYHIYSFLTGEDNQLPGDSWLLGWLADGNLYGLSRDKTDVVSVPPQGGEPALRLDFFLEIEGMDVAPNGSHAVVRPYLDRDRIQKGEIPDTEIYLLTREGYSSLLEPEKMPGLEQINRLALRPSGDHRVPDAQYSITPEPPEVETNTDFAFIAKINGQEDIFLSNAEQGSLINLTNDPAREESYVWSPDGSLIIYRVINYGADGKYQSAQLWSVRPDGTEKKMLLDCPNQCSNAAFSPDGSLIAVLIISSIDGVDQVDVMRPDGSERRTIMRGLNWTSPLIWSPDSRMVAAQQINPDGMRPIAVYQFDSDSVYFYSITTTQKNLMQWSPSGDEMLYFDTTVSLVPHILSLDDESDRILEVDGIPFRWRKDGTLLGGDTHAQSNSIFTVRADGSNYKILYSFPWMLFGWDITETDDLIFVPEAVNKEQVIEPGIYRALPGNEPVKVIGAQEIPGLEFIRMVLWRHRD